MYRRGEWRHAAQQATVGPTVTDRFDDELQGFKIRRPRRDGLSWTTPSPPTASSPPTAFPPSPSSPSPPLQRHALELLNVSHHTGHAQSGSIRTPLVCAGHTPFGPTWGKFGLAKGDIP